MNLAKKNICANLAVEMFWQGFSINVIKSAFVHKPLPGTLSPASSARVGNKSTNSTSALDTVPESPWPLLPVKPGTWTIRGTLVATLKLLNFDHSKCSPNAQPAFK